ncbi:MAG: shikimate dehydrogenase [Caldimonas sp.]
MIGAGARYAVAGHPVEHSHSPFIHAEFARQVGHTLTYERLLCPRDAFAATVQRFAAEGASGCNVTLPFKFEAFAVAARRTPRATQAQVCNTLRFDRDGWHGDNTDGAGLLLDIVGNAGVAVAGARILLIGAGGAAAGVLGPLWAGEAREIVVANRTPARAEALVARHLALGAPHLRAATLADCGKGFDIVVNASASSVARAEVPVSGETLRPGALAVDMMYGPLAAPFLAWAARHGATGRDGLGMLVEQAAEAFLFFRGVRPRTADVLTALRAHVASSP